MAKFRKRPVVIDAEQWHLGLTIEGVCACTLVWDDEAPLEAFPHIHTLEGAMAVSDGDYIITGVKGEKYACKEEIFLLTYEAVEAVGPFDPWRAPCGPGGEKL